MFEAVGSTRTTRVDVRVVAATNQDLRQMVRDGEFRGGFVLSPEYFPGFSATAPREKKRIFRNCALLHRTVRHLHGQDNDTIPEETMRAIVRHSWPGNIRELQNYVARAVILSMTGSSNRHHSRNTSQHRWRLQIPRWKIKSGGRSSLPASVANWKLGGPRGAAARLGLKRTTLFYKMKRLGIAAPVDHWED